MGRTIRSSVLGDVLAIQDEIVSKIVTTLNLGFKLSERGVSGRLSHPADNLEAYDDFLRGMEYQWRFTKEGNEKARPMFEQAIKLDPAFVDAYVGLGFVYWQGWAWQWNQDPHALDRVAELADKANALDGENAPAHMLLSVVDLFKNQQYERAIADVKRAIALEPNYLPAYF
jgi:adenylate cyclase